MIRLAGDITRCGPLVVCLALGCVDSSPEATAQAALDGGPAGPAGSTEPACAPLNPRPFGDCTFAWGAPNSGNRASYLDFVSAWVGYEPNGGLATWSASAGNGACDGCSLAQTVASTSSMAVFYTYFIGFQACQRGTYCDCNTDSDGRTLCTDGAQWIRDNRAEIVHAYGQYAKAVYARSPNKPVIWWLEGDFVQYSYGAQSQPLDYVELGSLAREITCAIKANEPNAVVAMNHSPWIANDLATGFWGAEPLNVLDLVWVQGPGDSDRFVNAGDYNAATASYAWLHGYTGKSIMAETSYAPSGANDRWTTATAASINERIGHGVIGVLVNNPAASYQSTIGTLTPQLGSTCQ